MRSIFVTAFLLLATAMLFAQAERDPKFIDFNVRGVRLGDSESLVIKRLGKPLRRTTKRVDICGVEEIIKLHYSGLEVQLDRDLNSKLFVLEMTVTSPRLFVEPSIGVGVARGDVQKRFGDSFLQESTPGSDLNYLTRDNDNATFMFKQGRVKKIRLWINPC